jgi:hypothetical protein
MSDGLRVLAVLPDSTITWLDDRTAEVACPTQRRRRRLDVPQSQTWQG